MTLFTVDPKLEGIEFNINYGYLKVLHETARSPVTENAQNHILGDRLLKLWNVPEAWAMSSSDESLSRFCRKY